MSVSRGKTLSFTVLVGTLLTGVAGLAELGDTLAPKPDHAAIQYFTGPANDPLRNPRTIFFNDSVVVAWMHGGFIELASQDPRRGVIFHVLLQQPVQQPQFQRRNDCLRCHQSDASSGWPG